MQTPSCPVVCSLIEIGQYLEGTRVCLCMAVGEGATVMKKTEVCDFFFVAAIFGGKLNGLPLLQACACHAYSFSHVV